MQQSVECLGRSICYLASKTSNFSLLLLFSGYVDNVQHPDTLVAAGCENGEVVIWDFETRVVARTFKPHNQLVTYLAWGRSGHHLHSGSQAGEVSVWDVLNNAQV